MLHSTKGVIGLRLSGVSEVDIYNLSIKNIRNNTPFGKSICGNYKDSTSLKNTINGF